MATEDFCFGLRSIFPGSRGRRGGVSQEPGGLDGALDPAGRLPPRHDQRGRLRPRRWVSIYFPSKASITETPGLNVLFHISVDFNFVSTAYAQQLEDMIAEKQEQLATLRDKTRAFRFVLALWTSKIRNWMILRMIKCFAGSACQRKRFRARRWTRTAATSFTTASPPVFQLCYTSVTIASTLVPIGLHLCYRVSRI